MILSSSLTSLIIFPSHEVRGKAIIYFGSVAAADWDVLNVDSPNPPPHATCFLYVSGSLTFKLDCYLTNRDPNNSKRFLFCVMIGLNSNFSPETGRYNYSQIPIGSLYELNPNGLSIQCDKQPSPPPAGDKDKPTWHLGCKEVSLAPGEQYKHVTYSSGLGAYQSPIDNMTGQPTSPMATDFTVTYYDTVDLTHSSYTFNAVSCTGLNGQGNVVYWSGLLGVVGNWVGVTLDFSSIQVASQSLLSTNFNVKDSVPYLNLPCIPLNFLPNLPIGPCPPPPNPLQPFKMDLNLFDYATMQAPPGTRFPTFLNSTTSGETTGLRVETNPPSNQHFNMTGAESLFGSLRVCSSSTFTACQVPSLAEGRGLNVTVNFYNATTGKYLFAEQIHFIHDTSPPLVTSYSTGFDSKNHFMINLTATDTTTAPILGILWFSTDRGNTWNQTMLYPTPSLTQWQTSRKFSGATNLTFKLGTQIQYFVTIQDVVSNINYFGVGQTTVPTTSIPPLLLPTLVIAVAIIRTLLRKSKMKVLPLRNFEGLSQLYDEI